MATTRLRIDSWIAVVVLALLVGSAHALVPAGPHSWHWIHLVLQKLHYVPILLAAFLLGWPGTLAVSGLLSLLFLRHILRDWAGDVMMQADQLGELGSLWTVAVLAVLLANRIQRSLAALRDAHEATLRTIASCLEVRERATAGHSERVRAYTLELAKAMNLGGEEALARGAVLHDIGKIGTPDSILLKEGPLSPEEWAVMKRHPGEGAELLGHLSFLEEARALVAAHHERWDGSGYPRGLRGEQIPLGARIFAVADVLDALTTPRPYHSPLTFRQAAEYLKKEQGRLFDPAVIAAFESVAPARWAHLAAARGASLSVD